MPDPTHVKLHHQFCSFNRYVPACKKSTQRAFEILKFKNPAIWLVAFNLRACLHLTWEPDFSQTCNYGAWFKPQESTHRWTFFFCLRNPKNTILRVFLDIIPKMRFFPKNLAVTCLPLKCCNFMRSFRKILWSDSEKQRKKEKRQWMNGNIMALTLFELYTMHIKNQGNSFIIL